LERPIHYDRDGSFRGLLSVAVHHAHVDLLRRRSREAGAPDGLLNNIPAPESLEDIEEAEHRRVLLRWAMESVRPDCSPQDWEVFERRRREEPAAAIAAALGMPSANAVHQAYHRVLVRLREAVAGLDG
jgi:DNA-directed RNA polymerase specialized sigma24 family protein